ncbi:unnamed protein product [marine sediment metagenome]|uniref:Uncharacterized protein n=1 Tax=marine sediment metagenome TaxID=412755 RepID=X0ZRT0_9ZZZZ
MKSKKQKAKETIDVIEKGFRTEKKVHLGYLEWSKIKELEKSGKLKKLGKHKFLKQYFGKYQYKFIKGDMVISMIKILDMNLNPNRKWVWEIYAHDDKRLFEDVREFPTKKSAMKTVESYLG